MALSGIEVVPQFETEHYPEMLLITKDCRKKTCHPCKQWMGGRAVAFHPTVLLSASPVCYPTYLKLKVPASLEAAKRLPKVSYLKDCQLHTLQAEQDFRTAVEKIS